MAAMRAFTDWHTWPDAAPGLAGLLPDAHRPLTAAQLWFAAWYAEWEADFADAADGKPSAAKPS